MDRLIGFFEKLSVRNRVIVAIIFILLVLLITAIRNNANREVTYGSSIYYKNITSEQLLNNFTEDYTNRDDYIVISNIVKELKQNLNDIVKYYDTLDYSYSKKLSKNRFNNKIEGLFEKVGNNSFSIKLYKENYTPNTYIAEIISDESVGYIGFTLNPTYSTYNIFYIE